MADSKLTDLTALTTVAAGDLFYVVDISDTTDDAAGSSKKITLEKVFTTPTVTGTLTVLQSGGTPGTDEVQIYHDGSNGYIDCKDGSLKFSVPFGSVFDFTAGGGANAVKVGGYSLRDSDSFIWQITNTQAAFKRGTMTVGFGSNAISADTVFDSPSSGVISITNGTAGQWGQLKLGTYDSGTTTITDGLIVGHRSSGTPAAGLGSAILFNIDSSTTADQAAGRLSFSWATATHASRVSQFIASIYNISTEKQVIKSFVSGSNVITQLGTAGGDAIIIGENGTYDGIRLHAVGGAATLLVTRGDATSEGSVHAASYSTLGAGVFYAQFRTDGIRMNSLCSLGISSSTGSIGTEDISLARNAASVFEMNNGTAGRWGALKLGTYDSGTNTITDGLTVGHRSSGTPATGLGSAILFNIDSSTTADQAAGRLSFSWATATHASRLSKAAISVYDVSTSRDAIVCEAISGGIENTLYGKQIIRQVGGTPGTDEGSFEHDGSDLIFRNGTTGYDQFSFRIDLSAGASTFSVGDGSSNSFATGRVNGATATYITNTAYILGAGGPGVELGSTVIRLGINGSWLSGIAWSVSTSAITLTNGSTGYASLIIGTTDSGTNTITDSLTIGRDSSGTPAAGLGSGILFNIDSSTTADRNASRVQTSWTVATDATRTSEVGVKTVTNAGSLAEVARFDGGGGASPSAGNTGLMIWDVDNNTLERVTVGAADSGGTGYKVLRIPN